jgi:FkbM family methyltransferase
MYLLLRRASQLYRYLRRRPHEADFACFANFRGRQGIFLDVGASSGTSAMSFRVYADNPIFSIEPNPLNEPDLRFLRRILPGFEFRICAAGAESGTMTLFTPVHRGIPITGESSLSREAAETSPTLKEWVGWTTDSPDCEISEETVDVRRLDDFGFEPAFVKIDVQGVELDVVRGLAETIERHLPVFLIERSSSFEDVRDFLSRYGYEPYVYLADEDRLAPLRDGEPLNVFFLTPDDGRPDRD